MTRSSESPDKNSTDKLTTDPPRPPGTPDVDELVGEPTAGARERIRPDDAARTGSADPDDTVSIEPPD